MLPATAPVIEEPPFGAIPLSDVTFPARQEHIVHHIIFPHLLDTVRSFLSVVVIALFVLTFIVQPFRIPSESMERTLLVGDFLLVNKMAESPGGSLWFWTLPYRQVHRGDIIVFHFPLQPGEHLVKRVVGIPGDHIRLINGIVYLNGKAQTEPYAVYRGNYPDSFRDQFPTGQFTDPGVDSHWWLNVRRNLQDGEIVVPKGHYFVLGDNRNNSRDSRYWGFVPRENIVGRPFVIYFSVRSVSPTDPSPLPGDSLAHGNSLVSALLDFARWDRMFQVVR
ncbi:Signal peptidase I [Acidisarcina polymorpha]|uniref:Signal peptidase I n=2 Tax=Acidisarcina polymorpha TaxID=2211140 RepID=A0A2Z5FV70_9BACT|nr:Signal peptidase I [Acidisarcina polymorpha]